MKKYLARILALLLIVTMFPFGDFSYAKNQNNKGQIEEKSTKNNNRRIIVKYKEQVNSMQVSSDIKSNIKVEKLESKRSLKYSKTEILEVGENDDVDAVIEELEADSSVEYAQPDYVLTSVSTDPTFNEQWGLSNNTFGNGEIDVNIEKAWDITKGNSSVIVGVLDEGIDLKHEDLKNNIYISQTEKPGNGVDDDGNGYIDDINGWDFYNGDNSLLDSSDGNHGTHIAGIIAADENETGIMGVAPNVTILPLKFMSDGQGYTSDAIEAIEYAKQKGVKIINASFGSTQDNPALYDAIKNSGILFVCAAGNDGKSTEEQPFYPASYRLSNIISVGSIDSRGNLSSFSNYGKKVDIAAPGEEIISTIKGDTYSKLSGTSMAAPFVVGVASLLKSKYPDMSESEIKTRIITTANLRTNLKDKIGTGGIVDAYSALINSTTNEGINWIDDKEPEKIYEIEDMILSAQAVSVSDDLLEMIHYGEEGVNTSTGNYSETVTDMSATVPGFTINISRTYNSKDDDSNSFMGQGWTFGFEGSFKQDTSNSTLWVATLPKGSVQVFKKNTDGTYTANDSRSTLEKLEDNTHVLTTSDQYSYGFNTSGYLSWMKDRNGNTITIEVDTSGKVSKIIDQAGNAYIVSYNSSNLINKITDPIGRTVIYSYDANNKLIKVTDPMGFNTQYAYDSQGYLNKVENKLGETETQIVYDHSSGVNQHKVQQFTNYKGRVNTYTYDTSSRKTTIKDQNGREVIKWYDTALYTIKSQDPEGKITTIEYYLDANSFNKLGEEKAITDRNGNKTQYERDDKGNITKVVNPDGTFKSYEYDEKNNEISLEDEMGRTTYYIYDEDKLKLLKEVKPLNGLDEYVDGESDESNYAIKTYEYYTETEKDELGYKVKGLLKSVTDPEGNVTGYTYDVNGNKKSTKDPEGNISYTTYNKVGWLVEEISAEGYKTKYTYNDNGQLEKTILDDGSVKRIAYDKLGRIIQLVTPNLYEPELDSTNIGGSSHDYQGLTGTKYTYDSHGNLITKVDAANNLTKYSYDIYGNTLTETKANGAIYVNEYDEMNRVIKTSFKEDANSEMIVLSEDEYHILDNGNTKTIHKTYINDDEVATSEKVYDYAERLIEETNPDGGKSTLVYNANGKIKTSTAINGAKTHYKYDGLNRIAAKWEQVGSNQYAYTSISYDKAGNKIEEKTSNDKVNLNAMPLADRYIIKSYTYYANGDLKTETSNNGLKINYTYDKDGNIAKEETYTDDSTINTVEYSYNHLGKVTEKRTYINKGDLYGNEVTNTDQDILKETYSYDKNGNLVKKVKADGTVVNYKYDKMDRQLNVSQSNVDEHGLPSLIINSVTYTFDGKVKTTTDANENVTTNYYTKRGFLEKTKKTVTSNGASQDIITLFGYDRAGRKTYEVLPENYDSSKSISGMNRIEYTYDKMGRVITKTNVYKKTTEATDFIKEVVKAYRYDKSGNILKELDGEGYASGVGANVDEKIQTGYGTIYTYNLMNKVATTLDPVSKDRELAYASKCEYDALGRLIKEVNAKGAIKSYYYDKAGNVTSTTIKKDSQASEETLVTNQYDNIGNLILTTDANGNKTKYSYNALSKVRQEIIYGDETIADNSILYQYDKVGNLKRAIDTYETEKIYTYDSLGKVLSETEQKPNESEKITKSKAYDKKGNVRFIVDGNGVKTEQKYDELDRVISKSVTSTDINGNKTKHITTYVYDKNNNPLSETDWLGNKTTMTYDPLGRVVRKVDALGNVIESLTYNRNSAQIGSVDGRGNKTTYKYDKNGRLIETIDKEGNSEKKVYDNVGNVKEEIDGNSNSMYYSYDYLNRLIQVTNSLGEITTYTYDLQGNMLTQTDGNGHTTTYEYNAINKPSKKINHGGRTFKDGIYEYDDSKVEYYAYHPNGLLKTLTDRNGNNIEHTYDVHGRLLSKEGAEYTVEYTYDNNGNLLTSEASNGEITSRSYDELGRVILKNVTNIGVTTFIYDITDGVESGMVKEYSKDPKGNITQKVYDQVGRLKHVYDNETLKTSYGYDENGNLDYTLYPDSYVTYYSYDKNNKNTGLSNNKIVNGEAVLQDAYFYKYDKAGNQIEKNETINEVEKGSTFYNYDSLNRLKSVIEPDGKYTTYAYDKAGNRLTEIKGDALDRTAINYTYDAQNRLLTTSTENADGKLTTRYSYDNNGNMVYKTEERITEVNILEPEEPNFGIFISGQKNGYTEHAKESFEATSIFAYDDFNQLTKVTSGNTIITYGYNAEGYRVEKDIEGEITRYLYEFDQVVLEVGKDKAQKARNLYGTNLISRTMGTEKLYYIYNGHGDVTALANELGEVVSTYYYDAFGNIEEETGTKDNPFRYKGYQYDEETELYYLNARMYDSKIARFLQEDTYLGHSGDPLSLNLYTYCVNNPIRYWDPSGNIYLQVGAEGREVREIQKTLGVSVTGVFDKATEAAVNKFKDNNGLGNTGVWRGAVGDQTLASIRKGKAVTGKELGIKTNHDDRIYINYAKDNQGYIDTSKGASITIHDGSMGGLPTYVKKNDGVYIVSKEKPTNNISYDANYEEELRYPGYSEKDNISNDVNHTGIGDNVALDIGHEKINPAGYYNPYKKLEGYKSEINFSIDGNDAEFDVVVFDDSTENISVDIKKASWINTTDGYNYFMESVDNAATAVGTFGELIGESRLELAGALLSIAVSAQKNSETKQILDNVEVGDYIVTVTTKSSIYGEIRSIYYINKDDMTPYNTNAFIR